MIYASLDHGLAFLSEKICSLLNLIIINETLLNLILLEFICDATVAQPLQG